MLYIKYIYIYIYILKVVGFFYREMLIGVSKIFDNELFLETFYETEKVIDFFNSFFFFLNFIYESPIKTFLI